LNLIEHLGLQWEQADMPSDNAQLVYISAKLRNLSEREIAVLLLRIYNDATIHSPADTATLIIRELARRELQQRRRDIWMTSAE
jgi:hypothetical protein